MQTYFDAFEVDPNVAFPYLHFNSMDDAQIEEQDIQTDWDGADKRFLPAFKSIVDSLADSLDKNKAFDLSERKAQICHKVLTALLSLGTEEALALVPTLLAIPAVVRLEVANDNQCLKSAAQQGSVDALRLILSQPLLMQLAKEQSFYPALRDEALLTQEDGAIDVRELVGSAEGSMKDLSPQQQEKFNQVLKQYPEADAGVALRPLVADLEARYQKIPAQFQNADGSWVPLPLSHDKFLELSSSLDETDKKKAYRAYYQHKVHTAWRYLQEENPWINQQVNHVQQDLFGLRIAGNLSDVQKRAIASFYRAAGDEHCTPVGGMTLESRVENFIRVLADIARAHNWDKQRINPKNNKSEYYDDLEADNPTCAGGVIQRLNQSLQGHPLMEQLDEQLLKEELKAFLFAALMDKVPDMKAKETLCGILEKIYEEGDLSVLSQLENYNLTEDDITVFFMQLNEKYGKEFSTNISFIAYLVDIFNLNPDDAKQYNRYHLSKLFSLIPNFKSALERSLTEPSAAEKEQNSKATEPSAAQAKQATVNLTYLVLGGFSTALGAGAVALALTLVHVPAFMLAVLGFSGAVLLATGIRLFGKGCAPKAQSEEAEDYTDGFAQAL